MRGGRWKEKGVEKKDPRSDISLSTQLSRANPITIYTSTGDKKKERKKKKRHERRGYREQMKPYRRSTSIQQVFSLARAMSSRPAAV